MSASLSNSKKRQIRVRSNIKKRNRGQRSRISVFRSNKNIYVQLIGIDGNVIQSCSSTIFDEKDLKGKKGIDIEIQFPQFSSSSNLSNSKVILNFQEKKI